MKRQKSIDSFFGHSSEKQSRTEDRSTVTESIVEAQPSSSQGQATDTGPEEPKAVKSYKFQDSWKINRFWLIYDEEQKQMFCQVCKLYDTSSKPNSFREGCQSFRKKMVMQHEKSKVHMISMTTHNTRETRPEDRPLEKVLIAMEAKDYEHVKRLFRTAYYMAKNNRPYSDFSGLSELQRTNGVELGATYCNDKQAHTFVEYIHLAEHDSLIEKLNACNMFSFISDASQDKGNIDEEGVYVRYIDPDSKTPITSFVAVRGLEKSDAETVYKTITSVLENDLKQDWKGKLVGCCLDGASVNMGKLNGVAARVTRHVPHLIVIHCCAHRLELVLKDMMKTVPYFKIVDDFLESIYKFYKNSPLAWSTLKQSAKALELPVLKPTKVTGTRWLGHHETALTKIHKNWPVIVTHLEQVALQGMGIPENKERAKAWLKILLSSKFVMFTNFLIKFFKHMSFLSETLQKNDITPQTVVNRLKSVKSQLLNLSDEETLHRIIKEGITFQPGKKNKFHDKELDKPVVGAVSTRETDTSKHEQVIDEVKSLSNKVITSTIQHMDERFMNLTQGQTNKIIEDYSVFDPAFLPSTERELTDYGNDHIISLYNHFSNMESLNLTDIDRVLNEWGDLKTVMYQKRRSSQTTAMLQYWSEIIKARSSVLPSILSLVQTSLVLPTNSAECERGFSIMKNTKTDWRAKLSPESLTSLMFISMNCTENISEYDPDKAIKKWWASGKQSRRPTVKPYGSRSVKTTPQLDSSTCSGREVHHISSSDDSDSDE